MGAKLEETLLHTLTSLTTTFPTSSFRYFTLIDIDMRSFFYSQCREGLPSFLVQLFLKYNCDVHWTTRGGESDWIKRWVIALEKCAAGHAPCAFRTRVTHSLVAKHPAGVNKNWISQLIQIPGVDYFASVAIAERFPTPNDIISFMITQQNVKDAVSYLSSIMVHRSNGSKPLTSSVASRLYYLFNMNSKRTDWIIPEID
ncbi:uncharacterized protein LOC128883008 [Hylaeus volcanicus]|uniref:uncharacterized protein LOC128883008 n=1 Tax=Hylaeus volcanicus TaxID=313075 RepID=UPI0023B8817D|nr:uncharacterized protein LOC128883008 [Hylaeus volcanicus]XP_053990929.1 uncharacterized protein LOC128883008 [Hylaeus volcanicus]